MIVMGIDLSGPANAKDTAAAIFQLKNDQLIFKNMITDASDEMIISSIHSAALIDELAIGIDAPLSYQDGGGDRPRIKKSVNLSKVLDFQEAQLCLLH
jgi:predicted nuclease with RNAse H fold